MGRCSHILGLVAGTREILARTGLGAVIAATVVAASALGATGELTSKGHRRPAAGRARELHRERVRPRRGHLRSRSAPTASRSTPRPGPTTRSSASSATRVRLLFRPTTKGRHFPDELGIRDLQQEVPGRLEVLEAPPHDLHVLRRHRQRVSRASRSSGSARAPRVLPRSGWGPERTRHLRPPRRHLLALFASHAPVSMPVPSRLQPRRR
jgi:hypothetical protein